MEYLLFIIYLPLFAWLVTKTRFLTTSGLTKPQLIIIFLLKVIAGIFYGWVGLYYGGYAEMKDTWHYHQLGVQEYHLLSTDTKEYFTNLFYNDYPHDQYNFFASADSFWNDLKTNIFIKFLSIFDVFSFGHYYVNVVFYSFISMIGPVALFRVLQDAYPGRKVLLLATIFLVPSFLYWSSGLHKEGITFLGISLIIYQVYFGLKEGRMRWYRVAGILAGCLLLFVLRNYVLVLLIPPILSWLISRKIGRSPVLVSISIFLLFGFLFFSLRHLDRRMDFPAAVVEKQQAFMRIKGHSSIPINKLEPTVGSFLANTPQAINLSLGRPFPSDVKRLFSVAAAAELTVLYLFFLVFLIWHKPALGQRGLLGYFLVFFSLMLLLSIGFTVNNLGAIVRYRSIVIPLLIPLMMVRTDWDRIGRMLRK